jgi:threonine dehydrogenase-like Zn-dependent dehydrogenase
VRGVVMYSAGDVRVVDREDPKIIEPTDAIIKLSATCICGSTCGRTAESSPPITR